jgi:hypothetical protein
MGLPSRRTLIAAAPALAAGGSAGATGSAPSAVAEAYAAYLLVGPATYPKTGASETEEEFDQAEEDHEQTLEAWFPRYEAALERLIAARSVSLEDLELKLRTACEDLEADGIAGEDLVASCLRDLRAMLPADRVT